MLKSCHGLVNTPYTVTCHAIQTWHRTNFFHQNLKWLLVLLLNKELTLTPTNCIKLSHVSTLFPGNLLLLNFSFSTFAGPTSTLVGLDTTAMFGFTVTGLELTTPLVHLTRHFPTRPEALIYGFFGPSYPP